MSEARFGTLATLARIVEPRFGSATPVVGPAVVGIRNFWNWMSTKWYVRQVIQQQNSFNDAVVDGLESLNQDLAMLHLSLETWEGTAVQTERSAVALNRDLALLEGRLQRMENRLERIEKLLQGIAERSELPHASNDAT